MKKLFSSQDAFELQAIRSELDALSIPYMVKNEFASGAIGELPWQDSQQEVWLVDDSWYARASKVVDAFMQNSHDVTNVKEDWRCKQCGEENGGAFEVCWQCDTSPHN
ncbi:hypothetical protein KUL118_06550 [Tenacibaculum sp. KUL118]|nr:hypothetical protein KUL118_06550 [Tenacibaculum sp. KUL118]